MRSITYEVCTYVKVKEGGDMRYQDEVKKVEEDAEVTFTLITKMIGWFKSIFKATKK